jgi:hypothetical protein
MHSPSRMPSKYYVCKLRSLEAEAAVEHGFEQAAVERSKQHGYF